MAVGPLKSLMASAAAVGVVAGPLTGNAVAQDAELVRVNSAAELPPMIQAGQFGNADRNNIGVMIYYGTGNEPSPDQVGNYILSQLDDAAERVGAEIDSEYFYSTTDAWEGIVVSYTYGATGMEDLDVRDAIKPETLDAVVDGRLSVNQTMERLASLDKF